MLIYQIVDCRLRLWIEDVTMSEQDTSVNRRQFFKTAGAGITAAGLIMTPRERALAQAFEEKNRLDRIAACSYPIRYIFKTRAGGGRGAGGGGGAAAGARAGGQPTPGPDQPPSRAGGAGVAATPATSAP